MAKSQAETIYKVGDRLTLKAWANFPCEVVDVTVGGHANNFGKVTYTVYIPERNTNWYEVNGWELEPLPDGYDWKFNNGCWRD